MTIHSQPRAVFFDMDGVLFDSMPAHAKSWNTTATKYGFDLPYEEVFMHEGRTGFATINMLMQRKCGRDATQQEIDEIYEDKCIEFNNFPAAKKMPGAHELLIKIAKLGIPTFVVTGSGQASLLERLQNHFPGLFQPERIISSKDVKHGKPHPEPYLMALERAGIEASEAIVVENAPLGVRSARAAGIFTIAVNTGPLPKVALEAEGANLIFNSMNELCEAWETLKF
ncbi:MAG: HAD-IA family hydrolase [Bacteroidaceae bacterium]|nr:HAD-IA family hydrolase [Bacteroidaceae bacterium]